METKAVWASWQQSSGVFSNTLFSSRKRPTHSSEHRINHRRIGLTWSALFEGPVPGIVAEVH